MGAWSRAVGPFAMMRSRRRSSVTVALIVAPVAAVIVGAGAGPVSIAPTHSPSVFLNRLGFGGVLPFTPVGQQIKGQADRRIALKKKSRKALTAFLKDRGE